MNMQTVDGQAREHTKRVRRVIATGVLVADVLIGGQLTAGPAANAVMGLGPSVTKLQATVGTSSVSGIDLLDLPACPAPVPDGNLHPTLKPLSDPAAPHCYISPSVTPIFIGDHRLTAQGAVRLSPATASQFASKSPTFDRAATIHPTASAQPLSDFSAQPLSGPLGTGPRVAGMYGYLTAQDVNFPGPNGYATANWIGVQDSLGGGANFIQVGLFDQEDNIFSCSTDNQDFLFAEVENNGTYQAPFCAPGYQFGVGSQTAFELSYNSSNLTWEAWINWAGTWEEVIVAGFGTTPLAEDTVAYPSNMFDEVNEVGAPWPAISATDKYLLLSFTYGAPFYYRVPSNESAQVLNNPGEDCSNVQTAYNDIYYTNCS